MERANTAGVCINFQTGCPSDSLYWEPVRDENNRLTGNAFTCMVCDVHWVEWMDWDEYHRGPQE